MVRHQSTRNKALADGVRAFAPLLIAVIPFGLVFGIVAAGSEVGPWLGGFTSFIIFAGAAQLATLQLIDAGAAGAVVIATALVINARHLMYSAALAPAFREFPKGARFALPYLLTDQAFALSIVRFGEVEDPAYRLWFFTGAGLSLWVPWQIFTIAGIVLGAQIPASWSLDFAIPLMFVILLVPTIKGRPDLLAAVVGATVAIVAAGAPYGLGLIIGAVSGVVAGVVAHRAES
ncbi:MAG: AzlC family ABC transporter permease [Acidimicrobiia bacterium]